MLLNEATAQERLNSPRNLANRFALNSAPSNVTEITMKGKGGARVPIPPFIKTTAAILTRSGQSTQVAVADAFGFTKVGAHHIDKGDRPTGIDEEKVEHAVAPIRNLALEKLAGSLMGMKQEKMDTLGVKDLSTVAANMSRVVEKLTPKTEAQGNNININIFTPEPRKEAAYETVSV